MAEEASGAAGQAVAEAQELLRQKRPTEAAEVMRAYLAGGGGTAADHMLLGIALAQAGHNRDAIPELEQAISMEAGNAVAHFNLGLLYRQVGRSPDALREFERALALRPEYPAAASAAAELRRQAEEPPPAAGGPQPLTGPPAAREPSPRLAGPPPATTGYPGSPAAYGAPAPWGGSSRPERPVGLTILVILNCIGAVLSIIVGPLMILGGGFIGAAALGAANAPPGATGAIGTIVATTGVVLILMGLAYLIVGVFLWKGHNWARITYMVLTGISLLGNLLQLGGGGSRLVMGLLGIGVSILWLVILNQQATKDYCTA